MPYLAFFFLGLFYIFRRIKPSWLVVLPYGVMAVTFLAFYLSFWPVSAHDLKFGCLRYLLGWYSLAGIVCLRALQMLIADLVTLPPKRRLRHALLAIGFGLTPLTLIAAIEPVDRWQLSRALIDQQRVTLRASSNPGSTRAALDGKLETAWHTQEAMRAGDWVEIRLDRVEQVSEIRLDLQRRAEESFPWRIRAFLDDGSGKWIPITNLRTGRHNHIWRVIFPRRALRAIRIEIIQPSHPARWWIHELSVRR